MPGYTYDRWRDLPPQHEPSLRDAEIIAHAEKNARKLEKAGYAAFATFQGTERERLALVLAEMREAR